MGPGVRRDDRFVSLTMTNLNTLRASLDAIHARIAKAARDSGRKADAAELVAVTKSQPPEAIREALAAGQCRFGENRVGEAKLKWNLLKPEFPDATLHLIGPLQTNKVPDAVALFDVIETVDRDRLARALASEMDRSGRRPDCLVQVNTGEEPQKGGVLPGDAEGLVRLCRDLGLPLRGLMCIPPVGEPPAPHFALLAEMARRHGLGWLSMGMSGDFETAIALGATHVRIGTAIFGRRA